MQFDFFGGVERLVPAVDVSLQEHGSSSYAPRTGLNARGADLTVAFAVDFDTAGERLTKRVAGDRFVAVDMRGELNVSRAAQLIVKALECVNGSSLNVAGNGIYTYSRYGFRQHMVNQRVYAVLAEVHRLLALSFIRSGGQTGADVAGLVAGIALEVPVIGLWPRGFKQRGADQVDVLRDVQELETELRNWAKVVRSVC